MISIEKCRELVPESEKYTDSEIEEIRRELYAFAELGLEVYFKRLEDSKKEFKHGNTLT